MKHIALAFLIVLCCGCIDPLAPVLPSVAPTDIDDIIRKLDAETYQPDLPDCLKGSGAALPLAEAAEVRQVYYYPAPFPCGPCRLHESDAKWMRDFKFVRAEADAWSRRQTQGYPHFRWEINGKWRGETHGWTSPDAFRQIYANSFRLPVAGGSTTFAPRTANAPAAGLYYRESQSTWTWPGNLRYHLTLPPHNLSPARVSRMTDAECMAVHDAYHNKYGMKATKVESRQQVRVERAQRPQVGVFGWMFGAPRQRACPGGVCPI